MRSVLQLLNQHRRLLSILIVAAIPAVILWQLIESYRFEVPQLDDLAFTQFYLEARDSDSFPWDEALAFHNEHRVAFTRLAYYALFRISGEDFGIFTSLSYFLALFVAAGLTYLGRSLWMRSGLAGGAGVLILFLLILSPAAVYSWQMGFIFGNFIPWFFLVSGLLVLHSKIRPAVALPMLAVFAICATYSFAMGLLLFVLFPAHAWLISRWPGGRNGWIAAACWGVTTIIAIYFAMGSSVETASDPDARPVGLALALREPVSAVLFFLNLLGLPLGNGTSIPFTVLAPIVGLAVAVVWPISAWLVFRRWRTLDLDERQSCMVWLTVGAAGIASAALITVGRLTRSGILSQTEHYVVTCAYGLVGLVGLLVHFRGDFARRLVPVTFAVLIFLSIVNWSHGARQMKWWKVQSLQRRASIEFMDVLPRSDFKHLNLFPDTWELTRTMVDEGFIDSVKMAGGSQLSKFKVLSPLKKDRAQLQAVHEGVARGFAQSYVREGEFARPVDAIFFAWQPMMASPGDLAAWQIFDVTFPIVMRNYYDPVRDRKDYRVISDRFEKKLAVDRIDPADGGAVRIRAFAYDAIGRRMRMIPGDFQFADGAITRVSSQ